MTDIEEEEDDDDVAEVTKDSQTPGKPLNSTAKLRKIVRKIRKSVKLRQKLRKLCIVYGIKPLVPIIDVETRWNSTYRLIVRAFHLKHAIEALCVSEKNLQKFQLTSAEWEELKTLSSLLHKFDRATNLISMERHCTFAQYLPTFNWLVDTLRTFQKEQTGMLAAAVQAGLDKLLKYEFNVNITPLPFIATILDPALKLNYFKEHNYSNENVNNIKNIVSEYFELNYENQFEVKPVEPTAHIDELFDHIYRRSTNTNDKVSGEFLKYLSAPLFPAKVSDPLTFWKSQENEFPCLSRMARDIFSIQSSSVAVERDNAIGAEVVTPNRCSLNADTIRAAMCLRNWLKD